jgi:hypothetical protein
VNVVQTCANKLQQSQVPNGAHTFRLHFRCATQDDGSVVCWGNPDFGGDASATAHMLQHSVVEAGPAEMC